MVLDSDGRRVFSAADPGVSHIKQVRVTDDISVVVSRDESSGDIFVSSAYDRRSGKLPPEMVPMGLLVPVFDGKRPYLTAGSSGPRRGDLVQTREY